ncbi:MAG: helix-turn-helix domain-containing protein [Ruminococcaceae bacterium]|nr:helix-turn-helix domain-containing protein [Oscillospiraceae bacterium]
MSSKSDYLIDPREIRKLVHKNAENSFAHTTYKVELERFRLLAQGDYMAVDKSVEIMDVAMQGKLSDDPLRNMRYLFIVNTGLATRFAIEAGAPQELVYSTSDVFIRKGDVATTEDEIRELNKGFWEVLVGLVRDSREKQHYSKPVTASIDYITSNFNSKVTLADLAEQTELTPNYLAALFKQETGLTAMEYLTGFRIDSACALLSQTEYSYLQIALSLGFCTQSYFTKVFREHVGCTPRIYRQQHTDKAFSEFVR